MSDIDFAHVFSVSAEADETLWNAARAWWKHTGAKLTERAMLEQAELGGFTLNTHMVHGCTYGEALDSALRSDHRRVAVLVTECRKYSGLRACQLPSNAVKLDWTPAALRDPENEED